MVQMVFPGSPCPQEAGPMIPCPGGEHMPQESHSTREHPGRLGHFSTRRSRAREGEEKEETASKVDESH